jgi:two-component system sensor histidine kinase PilS (NtrC family)
VAELIAPAPSTPAQEPQPLVRNLLRWLYIGRLTIVTGIFAGAFLDLFGALPAASGVAVLAQDFIVVVPMFVLALTATAASVWYTHWLGREPGEGFLYGHVVLDVLLVTAIVQVTGGQVSGFSSLYILVISEGALLLPLPGGVLIGALVSIVYFALLAWGRPEDAYSDRLTLGLNIGLFSLVAIITGLVGDRLRRAGQLVASQLRQLRLDTGDILANLSTGVITLTGEGRLAYANPAAETLLGAPLQARIGEPLLDELDEIAPGMGKILEAAIRERRPVTRARARANAKRGVVQLGVSTAILERARGEAPSVTALFQDITELQRLEELKLRTERLEAVAGLSASLAHEIKNPLASIRSSVEQLGQGRISDGDRAVLQRLVLTESDRLSRLLSEFLDFSGLKMSAREEFDLHDVVRECLMVVKQHPDNEGVDIASELDEGPLPMVGDADLIHRALFNLVLNGAQSAGTGGRVVVSLEDQRDRPRPRGTDVEHPFRLTVSDSGAGIVSELRTRIFDPFFTTKPNGSGLGLAVVHRAVEEHSGATFVEQGPEGGAQFVIFLPGVPEGAPVGAGGVSR